MLVAVGAAVVVVARRDEPVALEVEGKPIRNAGAILAQAEAAFGAVVEADGAEAPEAARCYFAPPASGSG
ncbi:MAG: hypothetical protein ACRDZV_15500, partial [Acidimicrobiia bacterium]